MTFQRKARSLEKRAVAAASLVLAVSTPLADLIRVAVPAAHVKVLPNGVDPNRFDPAKADGRGVRSKFGLGDRCVVGWVGILRAWHGLDLLVDAVAGLDDVYLLLVGDGPERAAIETRVKAAGIAERVAITGRIAHDAIPDHVAAMDVCVIADERTGVASPMKLVEYMSMGRAIVAPDLPNIRDLVTHDSDGVLFEPSVGDSFRRAVMSLAADAPMRRRLGRLARSTVVARRSWRANANAVASAVKHIRIATP